jgi:hypothetical protein
MATVERSRSRLLSIWLICLALLFAAVAIAFIITLVNAIQSPADDLTPTQQWAGLLMAVLSIVNVGAAIALWNWRRIGYFIFIISAIPMVILNLLFGVQFLLALFPLFLLSTLWTLLKPYWNDLR